MTETEKRLITVLKSIQKEASRAKPDPDKIYWMADDIISELEETERKDWHDKESS